MVEPTPEQDQQRLGVTEPEPNEDATSSGKLSSGAWAPLARISVAAAAVVTAFVLYDTFVTPWVAPPKRPRPPLAEASPPAPPQESYRLRLQELFSPGDWELNCAKVLQTRRGMVLINDYQPLEDKTVKITPCTMVLFSDGEPSFGASSRGLASSKKPPSEGTSGRPFILRCASGAELQFSEDFDLERAKIGKLLSGRLVGEVVITSPETAPGDGDDVHITTRNVQVDPRRIFTPSEVRFRIGPHHGAGRDLTITLTASEDTDDFRPTPSAAGIAGRSPAAASDSTVSKLRGVQSLELAYVEKISLQTVSGWGEGKGLLNRHHKPGNTLEIPPAPIEITCRGPFQLDFLNFVASFEDQVDVLRRHPEGPVDQLNCELLEVHFYAPPEPANSQTSKKPPLKKHSPKKPSPRKKPSSSLRRQRRGKQDAATGMKLRRIIALGEPVILRAPSAGASARGDRLEHDFQAGRVTLQSKTLAVFQHLGRRIESAHLYYLLSPTGQVGQLWAKGPGKILGSAGAVRRRALKPAGSKSPLHTAGGKRSFEASWQSELQLQPDAKGVSGQHVVTLKKNAEVKVSGAGGFRADEIHLWLNQKKKADSANAAADAAEGLLSPNAGVELTPDRMLALGNVRIRSIYLQGGAQQLEVWFDEQGRPQLGQRGAAAKKPPRRRRDGDSPTPSGQKAGPQKAGSQTTRPPTTRPKPTGPKPTGPKSRESAMKPNSRYEVYGRLIQVRLVRDESSPPRSSTLGNSPLGSGNYTAQNILLRGDVRFAEIASDFPARIPARAGPATVRSPPAERFPLVITGDLLVAENPDSPRGWMKVLGAPASVAARGTTLMGGNIQLDRRRNRMWIRGPGEMRFPPPNRSGSAAALAGEPAIVTWKGGLHFDGRAAHFEQQVEARLAMREQGRDGVRQAMHRIRSERLQATLSKPIRFSDSRPDADAKLKTLYFENHVQLESRSLDPAGKLSSQERAATENLLIDQQTGQLRADGGGWVSAIRSGAPQWLASKRPGRPPPTRHNGNQLTYLRVEFEGGLQGNHLEENRHVTFQRRVRTIYGPVPSWEHQLDPDRPDGLGNQGVLMTCDELTVRQLASMAANPSPAKQESAPLEILAKGNTFVESETFTASGDRISYATANELFIMEGMGRNDARLWRRTGIGEADSRAAARKIWYYRDRDEVRIEDFQSLDVTNLPAFTKPRSATSREKP